MNKQTIKNQISKIGKASTDTLGYGPNVLELYRPVSHRR